ncbi:MAG: hypothetical protein OXC95_17185 [Dehalococcoidia bacterium]|nr:hypothetical protein [Dehalococcoidia bacterium]
MEAKNQLVLELDPEVKQRLEKAAAVKGISVRRYCLSAIERELAKDEANGPGDAFANKPDHEMFAELRREVFKGKPLPGNSVDLLREARDRRDGQASRRGFDRQAFERVVKRREEIFGGKPLPGNSVDFIREAREVRNAQMDKW